MRKFEKRDYGKKEIRSEEIVPNPPPPFILAKISEGGGGGDWKRFPLIALKDFVWLASAIIFGHKIPNKISKLEKILDEN